MVLFTLVIPMYVSIGVTENILVILSTPLESLHHFHNNQQPIISINFTTNTLYKHCLFVEHKTFHSSSQISRGFMSQLIS